MRKYAVKSLKKKGQYDTRNTRTECCPGSQVKKLFFRKELMCVA